MLLGAIAAESTRVAGEAQTRTLLFAVLNRLHLMPYFADAGQTNKDLRKIGHLCGYGLLALGTAQVWSSLLLRSGRRSWRQVAPGAAMLAVACTALVGSLDEWHQSYLPGRTSSVLDVLIDTLGAAVFVGLYVLIATARRRRLA